MRDVSADVVIAGAGPAGTAAAVQCTRLGLHCRLMDSSGTAGGLIVNARCIENYIGVDTPIDGLTFANRMNALLAFHGIAVERDRVHRVDTAAAGLWHSRCATGGITSRCVILATGTQARLPTEPVIDPSVPVFTEITALRRACPSLRSAIVVGGGEAACDYALNLADADIFVTVLVRAPHLRARGRLARQTMAHSRIAVWFRTRPMAFSLDNGIPTVMVSTENAGDAVGVTRRLSCGGILVAVGRESQVSALLPGVCQPSFDAVALTAHPGLYICGDARLGCLGQISMATGDGVLAAAKSAAHITRRIP